MSSPMKLSLLAFVASVAAVPHYGHSKYHKPSGGYGTGSAPSAPYPTGGWGGHKNSTALPYPTGTGAVPDGKTTTLLETLYSTATVVQTVYATKPGGGAGHSSVVVNDLSSTGAAACGPETVYVTATNKVTVTVSAGGAGAPSSAYTPSSVYAPSSAAQPVSSAPVSSKQVYEAPPAASTPVYSAPAVSVEKKFSQPVQEVKKPVPTSAAAPVSSKVEASTPVSSAQSTPTKTPSHSGGKRGLAYNDVALCSNFAGGNIGWAYNWAETQTGQLPEGVNYVPICHRPSLYEGNSKKWFDAVDVAVKKGSTAVMGFNEPDIAEQANLDITSACTKWKELMNPLASSHPDLTIIGPSVSNSGASHQGLSWLGDFAKVCPDAVWHAANIHFYDIYEAATIERFKAHIEKAASQTGKPIWLTEFGFHPGTATEEQAASFLKEALAYLDGNDKVHGYSYFMVGTGQNQLNDGTGLSTVGKVYASS